MIDVNGLRVIRAIGDEGGFTAAATRLGYSQPAVSQLVRRMEHRLGTALVERRGRSVRLTEAGQVLARHAITVLAAISTAEEEVAAISGLRAGRVRLQAFPSSSAQLVPSALAAIRAQHPDLSVTLGEAEPPESLAALLAGDCDVAVTFTYPQSPSTGTGPDDSRVVSFALVQDELSVALPATHPLAARTKVHLEDLSDEAWIAGCPRCRHHLLGLAERAGYTPQIHYATDDYVAVLGLVAAGLGVALVPGLVLTSAAHHNVVTRPLTPTAPRSIQAVTTPDQLRVPAVLVMVEALQRAGRALATS